MKYVIIGTAGHVDHGKSVLIKALTGVETDRLKEEKLRGISIDLGFASLQLAEDMTAGIVDVPGHERFLKNMLAGTGGIDLAMLVIAADEGVMPQTREHLAMLNLYGVKHGIVVVSKIDKTDGDWLELVEEDIRDALAGTFLAQAPFCRVSAVTGEGLTALKQVLGEEARKVAARDRMAPFRLWIDRAFTAHGYGAVVTGSILSGTVRVGDSLLLYPAGMPIRVRGLEWHGEKVEVLSAGQRAAINITGADLTNLGRAMFLSAPERGETDIIWDMIVQWHDEPVPPGTRVRLHTGTGEYIGRAYGFKNQPATYMRLLLEEPMTAGAGDRGILRLYSPQHLLGGAMLIGVSRRSRKMSRERELLAKALTDGNCYDGVLAVLADEQHFITMETLLRKAGYRADREIKSSVTALIKNGKVIGFGNYYATKDYLEQLTRKLKIQLEEQHKRYPDKAGLSREIAKQQLGLGDKVFEQVFAYWQQQGIIAVMGSDLALPDHAGRHQLVQGDLAAKAEAAFGEAGIISIDSSLVSEKFNLSPENGRRAFEMLVKGGQLIKMGDICVYRKTMQNIARRMQEHFQENATLTVAELRDKLNTSRKIALPLMEYFDLHKYTVRDGDKRRPGSKLKDLSE